MVYNSKFPDRTSKAGNADCVVCGLVITAIKKSAAQRDVPTKDTVNLIDSVTKTTLKRKSKVLGNGKKTTLKR